MIALLLASFLFIGISTFYNFKSQNMSIFGNVIDTLNNTTKKNAVVMLVRLSDSTMIDFKRTDDNGGFYFNIPVDTVEIIISHYKNEFFGFQRFLYIKNVLLKKYILLSIFRDSNLNNYFVLFKNMIPLNTNMSQINNFLKTNLLYSFCKTTSLLKKSFGLNVISLFSDNT